jgi:hypothetical protein
MTFRISGNFTENDCNRRHAIAAGKSTCRNRSGRLMRDVLSAQRNVRSLVRSLRI